MTGPYVIGCDIGSQGTNTALYAADGALVTSAYAGYDVLFPRPGWAEQDPRLWIEALHRTIRQVIGQVEDPVDEEHLVGLAPVHERAAGALHDGDLVPRQEAVDGG